RSVAAFGKGGVAGPARYGYRVYPFGATRQVRACPWIAMLSGWARGLLGRPRKSGGDMARSGTATLPDIGGRETGRGWQVFWGVLLILVGVLALMMPAVAALATALLFGWLLLFAG